MITKKDVLEALGTEEREDRFLMGMIVGLGAGAVVGGLMALLLAPKSGTEVRRNIAERSRGMFDRMRGRAGGVESEAPSERPAVEPGGSM